jgi:D-lactate dehydrogenase
MRTAFFEIDAWEKGYIKKRLRHKTSFFEHELTETTAREAKNCEIISVFIYSRINKKVLDRLPKLRLIATRSTGYDHINVRECKRKGVLVCNVPLYGENTVAEHTFALILAVSRKICQSYDRTKKGDFSLEGLRGFDLKNKTLGVVGVGNIGKHVIRIAKGFEMNVLAYDIKKDLRLAKSLGFKYVKFDYLLRNSDIITLHVPLNKQTHHLINKGNTKKIKKGAVLINTSRGGIVETNALLRAISEGVISGAGLDVLEEECTIKEEKQLLSKNFSKECDLKTALENHILLKKENVVITPHNAFNSVEALQRILDTTSSNINFFLRNKPRNVVK